MECAASVSPYFSGDTFSLLTQFESPVSDLHRRLRSVLKNSLSPMPLIVKSVNTPPLQVHIDVELAAINSGIDFLEGSVAHKVGVREMLTKIRQLFEFLTTKLQEMWKARLACTLKMQDLPSLLCELGLIYFYMERDELPPPEKTLFENRCHRIFVEIQDLQRTSKEMPSGVNILILRILSHTILDKSGQKNVGGLLVSISLVPYLSAFITEEQVHHLNAVLHSLKNDDQIFKLLATPIEVCPSMENFVRSQILLKADEEITPDCVRVACLMSLFHNLRQEAKNVDCFAIASALFALKSFPSRAIKKYQDFLRTGTLQLQHAAIPLRYLVKHRLQDGVELKKKYSVKILCSSTYGNALLRSVGIFPEQVILHIQKETVTLSEFIEWLVKKATEHSPQDESVIRERLLCTAASFKKCILQELLVCTFEFLELNEQRTWIPEAPIWSQKRSLTRFLQNEMDAHLKSTHAEFESVVIQDFMKAFYGEVFRGFWLLNVLGEVEESGRLLRISANGDEIVLPCPRHINTREVATKFSHHRRLLYINGDSTTVVSNYNEFSSLIIKIVDAVYNSKKGALKEELEFVATFKEACYSMFPQIFSRFLEKVNKDFPFTEEDYKKLGLIFFTNTGGTVELPLKFLKIPYKYRSYKTRDPVKNFLSLFNDLHSLPWKAKKQFMLPNRVFLSCANNHTFIIHPYQFIDLWLNNGTVCTVLQQKTMDPMRTYLAAKPLSLETKLQILKNVFANQAEVVRLYRVSESAKDANEFTTLVSKEVGMEYHFILQVAVEKEITKINVREIPWDKILSKIPNCSPNLVQDLLPKVHFHFRYLHTLNAFEVAFLLEKFLANYSIFAQKWKLEIALCEELMLPISWQIGDLNWSNTIGQEYFEHSVLVLKWLVNRFALVQRTGISETPIEEALFEGLRRIDVFEPHHRSKEASFLRI